jgi:hypothetical protein
VKIVAMPMLCVSVLIVVVRVTVSFFLILTMRMVTMIVLMKQE